MKRVAMIPARLESKRVPRKNLRFLGSKPLVAWVVETARASGLFDEVYINSECEDLEMLASDLGVLFYHRNAKLAEDGATSDDFVTDFLYNIPCDELFQVTPTSPFLTVDDMRTAAVLLAENGCVVSVREVQAECYFGGTPVNFDLREGMLPSQELKPVHAFCNGIFAWTREAFLERGCYGRGLAERLVLDGDSAIDIDNEEDFLLAEAVVTRRAAGKIAARYWSVGTYAECDASQVLHDDGVGRMEMNTAGVGRFFNLTALLASLPVDTSSAHRVVESPSNSATVISQMPGEGNRRHYHPDWDEWWLILEGQYEFEIEGVKQTAKVGDVITIGRGQWHQIIAKGTERASRLAVSRDGVEHVYQD